MKTRATQPTIAAGLFVILAALYFFTYSGAAFSEDETILFDGVHSMAEHSNLWLGYTNASRPAATYPNGAPVPSVDAEPFQVFAALPLFWLAEFVPGIGLMQTVWLFNLLVTAAAAVVVFYYALALGYSELVGAVGALIFGAATMAWPYTKTFFREPLFALLIFLCAYCLERARRSEPAANSWRFSVGWWLGAALTLIAAVATKSSALFLLPALIVIALPAALSQVRLSRRSILIGLGVVITAVIALGLVLHFVAGGRYDLLGLVHRIGDQAALVPYALAGYLLSPGRSVWAFSPVLLIGLWGVVLLWRAKKRRAAVVPLLALAGLSVGYAVLQNADWYGGLAWGPRYMLAAIPFLSLLILPVLEGFSRFSGNRRIIQIITAILLLASVGVQLLGTLIPTNAYYAYLASENVRLGFAPDTLNGWQAGTWQLNYVPAVVLPRLALDGKTDTDLAWRFNNAWGIAGLCMLLIALGSWAVFQALRQSQARLAHEDGNKDSTANLFRTQVAPRLRWLLPGAMLVLLALGLVTYIGDPRYGGMDSTLHAGLETLNRTLQPGEAVLLNDQAYRPFFMNFYKARAPIFVLPDSPGEVSVPGQPPQVISANADARVAPVLTIMLARLSAISAGASRWAFVTEFIPAEQDRTRATEQFLTRHYFPIAESFSANTLRIVEFSTTAAPLDTFPPWPQTRSGATFGDRFTLIGSVLPQTVQRGSVLPVSLLWQFKGWPTGTSPFDYSLNVSLIDLNGVVVPGAQRSGPPLGTFGLTSQWQPGGYYRDNHGLSLPADLAPGVYHIWALWYDWRDNSRLTVNGSDHADIGTVHVQ